MKEEGIKTEQRQFYAVFDGMSKDCGGNTAAMIAAETLSKYEEMLLSDVRKDMDKDMIMYLMEVNNKIYEAGKKQGSIRMNCTPFVRRYDMLSNKWGVLLC